MGRYKIVALLFSSCRRKPERLEFLYEPGHGVSFQNQDQRARANAGVSNNKKQKQSIPGALFDDDKTHLANDSWRKSHSDPLILIRQREQEARKSVSSFPSSFSSLRLACVSL